MPRKKVKIITFIDDREGREEAENQMDDMVNQGWVIVSAGGGSGAGLVWGFVILQHNDVDSLPKSE